MKSAEELIAEKVRGAHRGRDAAVDAVAEQPPAGAAAQRQAIVAAFRALLEGLYVHLPQKRSSYGFDPIQRLRLLGERATDVNITDAVFHREMAQICTDLRDAHTRYLGPEHNSDEAFFLPLMVERFVDEAGQTQFIASKIEGLTPAEKARFTRAGFVRGVKLRFWNAIPMRRAVDLYAEQETGGRPDARLARALESLTIRPVRFALSPDEHWVDIGFETARGAPREIRVPWRRVQLTAAPRQAPGPGTQALAYDPVADSAREVKKMLFARPIWFAEQCAVAGTPTKTVDECIVQDDWVAAEGKWLAGEFAANVAARVISHRRRPYGYLRIYSFQVHDDQAFLAEVKRLLDEMPPNGLIVDVRSNPGGLIWAAEGLLQLLTPNRVDPTRFSLLATDMTRALVGAPQNRRLQPWAESLNDAVTTGVTHSRPIPLTPVARCNNMGQHYGGPVVAVVDANTYSAGDLFAAGFVDNGIGKLISTDAATGGGGANVWTPRDVNRALAGTGFELADTGPVSFTVSARRAERSGQSGVDIEDTGVTGSFHHSLTENDLVNRNEDLLDYAAELLATESVSSLDYQIVGDTIETRSDGLDRVELDIEGVPHATQPVVRRRAVLDPGQPWGQRLVEVVGYQGAVVKQRRRVNG